MQSYDMDKYIQCIWRSSFVYVYVSMPSRGAIEYRVCLKCDIDRLSIGCVQAIRMLHIGE